MKKIIYIFILIGLILGASTLFVPSYLSTSVNASEVEITVPEGASLNSVSNTLFEKGIIKSKAWFNYKAKAAQVDRKIKPGTYAIPSNTTLDHIFSLLEKGIPEKPIVLTIPEGFTLYQVAQKVEDLGFGTKDEFIEATEKYFENGNYNFDTKDLYFNLEGYLYPDTYHFTEKQTVEDIVERLVGTMNNVFTEEYKARAKELNLSVHEILTVASLIEREAINDAERPTISGVIYNRLNQKMLLQIDASVIYNTGEGRVHNPDIYQSDLDKVAPFNTYKVTGLPPGPIASPGKASIHAALYPEDHDYLYYVLNEKEDAHIFSKTYSEHQKHVKAYRNRNK